MTAADQAEKDAWAYLCQVIWDETGILLDWMSCSTDLRGGLPPTSKEHERVRILLYAALRNWGFTFHERLKEKP